MEVYHKIKSILRTSLALAKAGFKLKNEGSYLGILWYLLDPLVMFFIFLVIRNITGKDIENYPLYLLIGLIMFNFFRKTTGESIRAIAGNSNLIRSIRVNREMFVISIVLKNVFSHFFEIILFMVFLVIFKVSILNILFYFLIFAFFCLFVLGFSFILSTVGVYIYDFGNLWNIFTRLLWFATPIFYSSKLKLPININSFNPVYYFITATRKIVIYNTVPESSMILGIVLFSLISFLLGIFIFEKFKYKFAEKI